jgi:tRNA (guanine9-N1)-methyltransferase
MTNVEHYLWIRELLRESDDMERLSRGEKKQLKRERLQEKWRLKKEEKKTKKPKADPLSTPDPVKTDARKLRRAETLRQRQEEEKQNPEILLDCDFYDIMTEKERASIAVQITHSYSIVKKITTRPMPLTLCGVHDDLRARLQKHSGFDQWNIEVYPHKLEADPRPKANFIYLTADAEEEISIDALTKDDVLVIGGFVDRNRHKGLTFEKARTLGIRSAKLPLAEFIHLISSQVLAVNHVVEILANAYSTRDWEQAVKKVVPDRKKSSPVEL